MAYFEWHVKVLEILKHLNVEFLADCHAYFGGGTLVSLRHQEHRLSRDIDLICSFEGYSKLRHGLYLQSYDALFLNRDLIQLPRELQISKYAVRFPIIFENMQIRFEIVAEGHLTLDKPSYLTGCSFPCVNAIDSFAQKLMANADRWPDHRLYSRDLIDIAVQRLAMPSPSSAIAKAERWYPVMEPLKRAVQSFQQYASRRQESYELLQVRNPIQIANGLDLLAHDFKLESLERLTCEQSDFLAIDLENPLLTKLMSVALNLLTTLETSEFQGSLYKIIYDSTVNELRVRSREQYYPLIVAKCLAEEWHLSEGHISESMIDSLELDQRKLLESERA